MKKKLEDTLIKNDINKIQKFFNEKRIQNWENNTRLYRLRVNSIKLFIDGVFESGTALWYKNTDGILFSK